MAIQHGGLALVVFASDDGEPIWCRLNLHGLDPFDVFRLEDGLSLSLTNQPFCPMMGVELLGFGRFRILHIRGGSISFAPQYGHTGLNMSSSFAAE